MRKPTKTGLSRKSRLFERVRDKYLEIARREAHRFFVVDARRQFRRGAPEIYGAVRERLNCQRRVERGRKDWHEDGQVALRISRVISIRRGFFRYAFSDFHGNAETVRRLRRC